MTVQGPVRRPTKDGMSHRGRRLVTRDAVEKGGVPPPSKAPSPCAATVSVMARAIVHFQWRLYPTANGSFKTTCRPCAMPRFMTFTLHSLSVCASPSPRPRPKQCSASTYAKVNA